MTSEEYYNLFLEKYSDMLWEDIANNIDTIKDKREQEELRIQFCNQYLYFLTSGYTKYDISVNFENLQNFKLFLNNVEKLGSDNSYFWGLYWFYKKDYKKCIENLDRFFGNLSSRKSENTPLINEVSFVDVLLEPYKNSYDGFWKEIANLFIKYGFEKDIVEYCCLIDDFYSLSSEDDVIDKLLNFIHKHLNYHSVFELLGYIYYQKKMWRNAICFFKKSFVDEKSIIFPAEDIYYMLSWCYNKCRDYSKEEKYLRKCAEINRYGLFVLNNLGYCLYRQKKLSEAKAIFEECLEKEIDTNYTANNYIRVLIALGRNKDAKDFIKNSKYRISKMLKDKVAKLDNSNARISKEDVFVDTIEQLDTIKTKDIDLGVKRQQFSNEKLLEDELALRLESGFPVFGMNIHVYNHEGDFYGRQYPFEIGRLDLLCEDDKGDLYIIELKKDSGYDDAYTQTARYLDWFEKSPIFKNKKIYGIICVNSPSQELIAKVKKDKRMRLFEYQISYTEIK